MTETLTPYLVTQALRIATGCHQKAAASHLRAETGAHSLRAHLELCFQQFYNRALQPMHSSHLIVTSPPVPRHSETPSKASCHRIITGLRVRDDNPNAPPLIFGGILGEDAYHLVRRLLRGRIIEKILRSQAPNKVIMTNPHPIDPANNCCPSPIVAPSPSSVTTIAPVLPPLRRLGR